MIKINGKEYTLALNLICKDETNELKNALESVAKYVDEIVVNWNGTNPETEKILKEYNSKIYKYEWKDDFGDARNFILYKTTADYVIWLDSDDIILNPERIIPICEELFVNEEIGAIWTEWLYDFDEYGNCIMNLRRERIVKRKYFKWVSRLHETLIQNQYYKHIITDAFKIKHCAIPGKVAGAAYRNLKIITEQYNKEHQEGNIDAKTVFDLARSLGAVGEYQKALEIYKEYVEIGGWDNDRATAYLRIAEIYRHNQEWDKAYEYDLLAIKMKPAWPDGYLGLATTCYLLSKWNETIELIKVARKLAPPYGEMPCDPQTYLGKPLLLLHYALFQLGRFEDCLKVIEEGLRYYPNHKILTQMKVNCEEILHNEKITRAVLDIKKEIEKEKDNENKLKALVVASPDNVQEHPTLIRLRNKYFGVNKNNRIVIFCGDTSEPWTPLSVESGIGGSEEAVINMAKELTNLGWLVDIYNFCVDSGNYDGVFYHNEYEYDINEHCDIFIAWRLAEFVKLAPKTCNKIYLWLHDIQRADYYNETILNKITKIFALSKYHRTNLPDIPDDKFFITGNGIIPNQFELDGIKKIPYKCIYASSPDRGLDIVLECWYEIKRKFPEATLHVFYGFNKTYDDTHKDDYNWTTYKLKVMELLKQDGIIYRGRVGHKELAQEMLQSEYWLYPTYFTEISCITAMKCQASGVIPITTDLAALDETVQYGIKVKGNIRDEAIKKEWLQNVLDFMSGKTIPIKEMSDWAKQTYSWENVAKQWDNLFRNGI